MANHRAIQEACEAVTNILHVAYDAERALPNPTLPANLKFDVYLAKSFKEDAHMKEGVSLFLYRVYVSANQRAARVRDVTGRTLRPPLPLELHFFLTIWAESASMQHRTLGWAMRVLDDYPVLSASLLNASEPPVFDIEEAVEVIPGQLTNEEMMRIWDDLHADYQLSIPYVARVVRIESRLEIIEGGQPVQRRDFEMQTPE